MRKTRTRVELTLETALSPTQIASRLSKLLEPLGVRRLSVEGRAPLVAPRRTLDLLSRARAPIMLEPPPE